MQNRPEIISYQKLRAFIGFTGILLPVAVVVGCLICGSSTYSCQHSISHYYYSIMHVIFVGVLCVLGGFLISYQGKDAWESRLSNLAGCFAFGVASFPTRFEGFRVGEGNTYHQYLQVFPDVSKPFGDLHFAFAGGLFICFTIFCLYFFQKPDEVYTGSELKKFEKRKLIYKICGWVIVVSILMIVLFEFEILPRKGIFVFSTLIFETTALWAFGTAWLIKGSSVLRSMPAVRGLVRSIR